MDNKYIHRSPSAPMMFGVRGGGRKDVGARDLVSQEIMRTAPIGAYSFDDPERAAEEARLSAVHGAARR